MSRADRIFKRLLRLFPAEFRGDFGDDMAQTFRDHRLDRLTQGGIMAHIALWWDTVRGVLTTAPGEHLDLLRQDVGYGLRNLRRSPGFTGIAVAALAVGIGANTAVFSIVNGALLEALPYKDPHRLVTMFEKVPGAPVEKFGSPRPTSRSSGGSRNRFPGWRPFANSATSSPARARPSGSSQRVCRLRSQQQICKSASISWTNAYRSFNNRLGLPGIPPASALPVATPVVGAELARPSRRRRFRRP